MIDKVKKKNNLFILNLEKEIGYLIYKNGYKASMNNSDIEFRVYILNNKYILSKIIAKINHIEYKSRDPKNKPFFHPGVILSNISRVICNLANIKKNDLVLDPFCGTGGLLIESLLLGANVVGIEIKEKILNGARINFNYYSNKYYIKNNKYNLIIGDASKIPFRKNSFDAVISDFPYGQSTSIIGHSLNQLYLYSIAEIYRILKKDKYAVIVSSIEIKDIIYKFNFKIINIYKQRIHKSLTRFITVIKKV